MPPLLSSLIPFTRRLSSSESSVVFIELFVLICLRWRLHHRCRLIGSVVEPLPPPLLSLIPWTRHIFLVLRRCLCRRYWVVGPVFFFRRHHRRCQFHGTVNTPLPSPSETFTQAHSLFCFLRRCIHCCRHNLGLIFLFRPLRRCCQLLRTIIATQNPPLSSPNPLRLHRRLRSFWRVVYSSFSADASVVVDDYSGPSSSANAADVVVNFMGP